VLDAATAALTDTLSDGGTVTDEALQALLAAVVRAYSARVEQGGSMPAFPTNAVSATDVAVTATAMLEAVDVGAFELSMWQTIKSAKPR